MSKSKIIAGIIFLIVYFIPFRMVFLSDEIKNGGLFIGLFLATIFGFFMAFAIGTNKPFDLEKEAVKEEPKEVLKEKTEMREAA